MEINNQFIKQHDRLVRVVNRCDTVYVQPTIPPDKPIPRFYKDCTKGFWVLLIMLLGSFAFRIFKAIYLKR